MIPHPPRFAPGAFGPSQDRTPGPTPRLRGIKNDLKGVWPAVTTPLNPVLKRFEGGAA